MVLSKRNEIVYPVIRRRNTITPVPSESVSITLYSTPTDNESCKLTSISNDSNPASRPDAVTKSTTDGTLSMISTPWSTDEETWTVQSYTTSTKTYLSWSNSEEVYSSLTVEPKTSTTYGIPSPEVKTSRTTLTLLSRWSQSVEVSSSSVKPVTKDATPKSGTLSSWTLESFTSTGLLSNSNCLKIKYPWSPNTVFSDTDIYPSTDSLVSRKGSRETVCVLSKAETPMNYIVLGRKLDDNQVFDWILVKQKGIPIGDVPREIDTGV